MKMRKPSLLAGTIGLLTLLGLAGPALAEPSDTQQIDQYLQQGMGDSVAQVNSVSELTDVDPNSWAFQALKSVVERFGCLEGYPNKTYLGNRPTSRYEFAAGLNACLEKVNELITASTADKATKEDLATLQRLQEEFRNELAALRGRVDALEAKTKDIESKLFNVNSKLDASVVMAATIGGGDTSKFFFTPVPVGVGPSYGDSQFSRFVATGDANAPATALPSRALGEANASFTARTSLNIRATFTGTDELLVRMRGVAGQDLGAVFQGIASGLGTQFYALGPGNNAYDGSTVGGGVDGRAPVSFDKIRYTTNLFSDSFRIFVGPRIDIFEFIDTNSFANNEEVDFSSGFFINNPLTTFIFAGPGGGFDFQIGDFLAIRAIYIAPTGGAAGTRSGSSVPFGGSGLFGGSYTAVGELEINPIKTASIKLQYAHFLEQGAVLGTLLNGSGTSGVTDVYAANVEWAIFPSLAIFGRYGYGNSRINGVASTTFTEIESSTWQAGFALPGLFGPGNTFAAAYGQPIRVNSGQFATGLSFVPSASEGNVEVFYRFQVSDRLSLTPDVQFYINPVNSNSNAGITVGTIRATFTF
ncbi:iron uptake porin [Gloeobacter morelensis MG652769]|uniref:Iron uptake porin n=2 Tax=Gloeobacter TaxID=33071 RepID=A0ABY3PI15_9CYAN|nr:iron uptake porin [Gloeobacter morelensis MG652769]